ncbi:hypothetical protein HBH1_03440 [Herbaspirillum sp. BH-1]|nr:hypothetical protein HBH1_03440 [Herbaspirillum sp. BH-1]
MLANSSRFSGTSERPRATRSSISIRPTSSPWKTILPLAVAPVGSAPIMALSRVDLPAPLGPMTVTIWPARRDSVASLSAATLP